MADTAGPSAGSRCPEIHWGREEVLALIGSVEEFFEDFYDGTKKKKAIWNAVAEHMREKGHYCSGSDCDKKWRNLKTTYIRVLQKQVHGDTTTRFEYFDALHHILGQEIDPLGMREQA
ncbi:Trihelix transcription factor GT-4 [Portunus trituberculatus]|uniref:Trihelix transcription factor GT-4 n=2 Tax=Portunus trituberculatus TaxID=210409 RepID=A0A5B7DJ21_PORTR|nr:Trihelix transcription factor GT-4 [Portunus trituberculatus]